MKNLIATWLADIEIQIALFTLRHFEELTQEWEAALRETPAIIWEMTFDDFVEQVWADMPETI